MRLKPLWRVSIRTTSEAEDAVSELLQAQFCQPASVHTDLRSGRTSVSVFLEARPAWDMCGREIRAALRNLSQCGLSVGQAIPSLTRIPPQDWAESWKHHFRPINIG